MEGSYETGKTGAIIGDIMAEIRDYINIMIDGLHKKSSLLDAIIESNGQLEKVINEPEMDMEQFGKILDEKDGYAKQITQLDEGFQSLFDKIQDEIRNNKDQYRQQILEMQQLIRELTDKAVQIQDTEARHRLTIEGQFAKKHKRLQVAKRGMNVAQNYYKNMSKLNIVDSQFLDKKN